jgi:pimeloyl-ACP methyl ester carboxylesterase
VELGAGKPAVVLEAGRNTTAASWQPVMSLLAPHTQVVAYDRAGLGGSPPAAEPVTIDRRRFRANWTALQAGLAAAAPQGRHVVVEDTGHNIPKDRPSVVADAILQVVAQVRGT